MPNSLDSPKTLPQHKETIKNKYFLNKLYTNFYQEIKKLSKGKSPVIELGSGGGFMKDILPGIITSDIVKGPGIDIVFSASKIPFKSGSIGAFVMLNVFHHIKNPEKALAEMERCLKKRGKIIMTEPYNTIWGRLIYQNFHHEEFNPQSSWYIKGGGRLTSANGALPWIIFKRDLSVFESKFPNLKVKKISPHTPFRYLISGGLSRPQIFPGFSYFLFKKTDELLAPFNKWIGMLATIEIQKKGS